MEAEKKLKIAILDLYEGVPNQGMRGLRNILREFGEDNDIQVDHEEFDVRLRSEVPDMSFDVFISSGGPGSPLESRYSDWEKKYFSWLNEVERWNANPANEQKKFVFFICHSFQLSARYYNVGIITKRRSTRIREFSLYI